MSNTTKGLTGVVGLTKLSEFVDEESLMKIRWAFHFIIFPCISVVGIAANVTSAIVISKRGFRRVSNVLMIGLAASDLLFLVGLNNVPQTILFVSVPQVFKFSPTVNYVIYILYMMFLMVYFIGVHCSMLIPLLITGERLLAIFTPLTFTRIVTPVRAVIVLSCLVIIFMICFTYDYIVCLGFKQIVAQGISWGLFYNTERYRHDVSSGLYRLFRDFLNYMTGVVPVVLVLVGSVVIGVKVTMITNKRRQLTSGRAPTTNKQSPQNPISRTTKTLLNICILYIACSGFGFLIAHVTRISTLNDQSLTTVLVLLQDTLISINSVGNFVIYVALNKTFKSVDMRSGCCRKIKLMFYLELNNGSST